MTFLSTGYSLISFYSFFFLFKLINNKTSHFKNLQFAKLDLCHMHFIFSTLNVVEFLSFFEKFLIKKRKIKIQALKGRIFEMAENVLVQVGTLVIWA